MLKNIYCEHCGEWIGYTIKTDFIEQDFYFEGLPGGRCPECGELVIKEMLTCLEG